MKNKKNPFIEQTAKDYDMDYETVDEYFKAYHLNFYEKLEEYIKERASNEYNPTIKGKCFFCLTTQLLEQKPMRNDGIPCQEYFVCPVCNASNSPTRLANDIKEGNTKLIK